MVAHIYNLGTQEAEPGELPRVQSHIRLCSEFSASQGYRVRVGLKYKQWGLKGVKAVAPNTDFLSLIPAQ